MIWKLNENEKRKLKMHFSIGSPWENTIWETPESSHTFRQLVLPTVSIIYLECKQSTGMLTKKIVSSNNVDR